MVSDSIYLFLFLPYNFADSRSILGWIELVMRDVTVFHTWNIVNPQAEISPLPSAIGHSTQGIWISHGARWQNSPWACLGHFRSEVLEREEHRFCRWLNFHQLPTCLQSLNQLSVLEGDFSLGMDSVTKLVLAHNNLAVLESRTSSENMDHLAKHDLITFVIQHVKCRALRGLFCTRGESGAWS